jgi:polysaccharide biosynthesis protein PslH
MRILVLTPKLPWPLIDGGRLATARLAESLARCGAEVEVLSLNPRKHRGRAAGPLPIEAVDIDTSRVVGPALRALTSDVPYIVARFVSREFREAVRAAQRRFKPDVVQIESPFLLPYASEVHGAKIVLRSPNVEFRIWERLGRRWIASSLKRYELRAMEQVDAIVPISERDAADFRHLGVTKPMYVVPCGVTPCPPSPAPCPLPTVGFIGALDYRPNQDAVRWIRAELWPRVLARMPEARLSIAGSSPPSWMRDVESVADAAEFIGTKAVMIAPLFAGGGMRIKVLEAMSLGKAVVATTIGAEGIDVDDLVIADNADAFADAVVRLLRDPAEAARLGAAARAAVAKRYDSDTLARGLIGFYETL